MTRSVLFFFVALLCLACGFVGAVLIGEQIARADSECNNMDRFKEFCNIGSYAPCEYYDSEPTCLYNLGYYAQEDYWSKTPRNGWHATLSSTSKPCARIYPCHWDGVGCVPILDMEYNPIPQQIYTSVACK